MKTKTLVHYITKVLVDVLFYCCCIACVVIPLQLDLVSAYLFILGKPEWMRLVSLMVPAMAGVYSMWQLKMMFKTLLGGNPFVPGNITAFRKIAVTCFVVAVCYAGMCFLAPTIATALVSGIFVVGGLFCLTLKDIFKQAYLYKEENDLTV